METPARRCYYDILGVDRKCDSKTLKKVYRKLALKFHPDKAPRDQVEAFTAKFQELNEAYEILSDQNERAWYDAHREQILTGKTREQMESQSGFGFDIDHYLREECYAQGDFYETYNQLFMKIKIEEETALEQNGLDRESPMQMANFGSAGSEDHQVKQFYTEWENFTTCKSFAFADMYNPGDYEGRRIKRIIDRENKKVRNEARKIYLAKIKKVVALVKSKDTRWMGIVNREHASRVEKANRERLEKIKKEKEWQERKRTLLEQEMKNYGEYAREDEEEDLLQARLEEFFCGVCNKEFKTEGALRHHNQSKQHLKRKKKIIQELMLEGDEEMLARVERQIEEVESKYRREEPESGGNAVKKSKKKRKKKRNREAKTEKASVQTQEKPTEAEEEQSETANGDKDENKSELFKSQAMPDEFGEVKKGRKGRRRRRKKPEAKVQVKKEAEVDTKFMTKKMKRRLKKKQKDEIDKLTCRDCKREFETRNALFTHLKEDHKYKW